MLIIFSCISNISFSALMDLYSETNINDCLKYYPDLTQQEALFNVESSFYHYLNDVFFHSDNSAYYVWVENGIYISALRLEAYNDGLLLTGLETHMEFRNLGYAKKLISEVTARMRSGTRIYSHIDKKNVASAGVHKACGFVKIQDYGQMLDGTLDKETDTYFLLVE